MSEEVAREKKKPGLPSAEGGAEKDSPEGKEKKDAAQSLLAARSLPVMVHAQYVKDVSFENPNAPVALRPSPQGPKMDININLDAVPLKDDKLTSLYEVVLSLSATATRSEQTVFLAEIHYGAVVQLKDIPEDQHHPLLLIEVPRMIFPYARELLSSLTSAGGYPPLLLNPVDFQSMYVQRFQHELSAEKPE